MTKAKFIENDGRMWFFVTGLDAFGEGMDGEYALCSDNELIDCEGKVVNYNDGLNRTVRWAIEDAMA